MVKVSHILRTAICALAIVSASAFAQSGKEAFAQLNEYRTKLFTEARTSGKQINVEEVLAKVKAKAEEIVKDVDVNKIEAKDALDWAQVYVTAGRHKDVCNLCHKFLTTNPEADKKFQAQMVMMGSCNALGEGDMLVMTLQDIKPVNAPGGQSLAMSTARTYADTIYKTKGLDAALKSLDEVGAKIPPVDVKTEAKRLFDQTKASRPATAPASTPEADAQLLARYEQMVKQQEESARYAIVKKKSDLLTTAGRKDEGKKLLKDYLAKADPKSPVTRSANAELKQAEMIGAAAPTLAVERSHGEFKGLEALKGKVVIIDFFAHWCGPCKASYPDMRKMYDELRGKGLEIVGVTTYYGYYGSERNIDKDTEFAKMADFIKEFNIAWPVVYGERTNFEAYAVTGIPHVTVLDRKGNVHSIEIGYSPEIFKKFRAEIEKLINDK